MGSNASSRRGVVELLQEFSIPLLLGVAVGLLAANLGPAGYAAILHFRPFGDLALFGHVLDFHFLVNDIFMVFFFGIAAKEITESCLPGGALNPPSKALNPLFATLGGVIGPVGAYFAGLWLCFAVGIYGPTDNFEQLARGWGIPTATDIALAWLVARAVFGKSHPAVAFLLLLAVADDAIGLIIIAAFYGDPASPFVPGYLGLVVLGMAVAFGLRRASVRSWIPYVAIAGPLSWSGLMLAHLHPALALAVIVPFMPGPARDTGMFSGRDEVDQMGDALAHDLHIEHSALHLYEHQTKVFVDFGLFFFAFANAGVELASVGALTWLVLGSLAIGKTIGIGVLGWIAVKIGLPFPTGMTARDAWMAGFVAALGLTVALFVASEAFVDPHLQGQAKMGALLSSGVGIAAIVLGRALGFGRAAEKREGGTGSSDPVASSSVAAPRGD